MRLVTIFNICHLKIKETVRIFDFLDFLFCLFKQRPSILNTADFTMDLSTS